MLDKNKWIYSMRLFSTIRSNSSIHTTVRSTTIEFEEHWERKTEREKTMYIVISSQFTFIIFANFCMKAFCLWLSCWSLAVKVNLNQCHSGLHRNWNKYFSAMNLPFSEFNNSIYNEHTYTHTHSLIDSQA